MAVECRTNIAENKELDTDTMDNIQYLIRRKRFQLAGLQLIERTHRNDVVKADTSKQRIVQIVMCGMHFVVLSNIKTPQHKLRTMYVYDSQVLETKQVILFFYSPILKRFADNIILYINILSEKA